MPRSTLKPATPQSHALSPTCPTLAIASLLAAPPAALAASELNLLSEAVVHPSFIIVLLGVTEGITIWILARTKTLIIPATLMTGVNLLSYHVGLGALVANQDTVLPEMAARIAAAFGATVLVEWPAVRLATRRTNTTWRRALGLCAVANFITFIGWIIYAPAA